MFVALKAKAYSYLTRDHSEDKKPKGTKKYIIKRKLKFKSYKNCSEASKLGIKIKYLQKKIKTQIVLKKYNKFIGNN